MLDEAMEAMTNHQAVAVPANSPPVLFVVVDTEEEFDWCAPFSHEAVNVSTVARIERAQRIFSRYGVKPTYVVDFPVASQPDGYLPIREVLQSVQCTVGAHLHPWVNPPFEEPLNRRNSFACNLGRNLEKAKIGRLLAEIQQNLGVEARVYKAGRYGFGPSTVEVLESLRFQVDMSILPHMDFSSEDGPCFTAFGAAPFFFTGCGSLLEIPCSAGYVGIAGDWCRPLHRLASGPLLDAAHLAGVLARLGITNRVILSPEGHTLAELRALTAELLTQGIRTFTLTFHSPSLEPGCTQYVQTWRHLDVFLASLEGYCDFFFGELGGLALTPQDFRTWSRDLMPPARLATSEMTLS